MTTTPIDPKLEAVLRAAINVADTAFVHQHLVSKTALRQPVLALIDALTAYPPYVGVRIQMAKEDRAAAPSGAMSE